MLTKKTVINALKTVNDPELGINIVDLGLVYDVKVVRSEVEVLLTLTFPGCPFGSIVNESVNEALKAVPEIKKVKLKLTFDPPWSLAMVSPEAAAEIGF